MTNSISRVFIQVLVGFLEEQHRQHRHQAEDHKQPKRRVEVACVMDENAGHRWCQNTRQSKATVHDTLAGGGSIFGEVTVEGIESGVRH